MSHVIKIKTPSLRLSDSKYEFSSKNVASVRSHPLSTHLSTVGHFRRSRLSPSIPLRSSSPPPIAVCRSLSDACFLGSSANAFHGARYRYRHGDSGDSTAGELKAGPETGSVSDKKKDVGDADSNESLFRERRESDINKLVEEDSGKVTGDRDKVIGDNSKEKAAFDEVLIPSPSRLSPSPPSPPSPPSSLPPSLDFPDPLSAAAGGAASHTPLQVMLEGQRSSSGTKGRGTEASEAEGEHGEKDLSLQPRNRNLDPFSSETNSKSSDQQVSLQAAAEQAISPLPPVTTPSDSQAPSNQLKNSPNPNGQISNGQLLQPPVIPFLSTDEKTAARLTEIATRYYYMDERLTAIERHITEVTRRVKSLRAVPSYNVALSAQAVPSTTAAMKASAQVQQGRIEKDGGREGEMKCESPSEAAKEEGGLKTIRKNQGERVEKTKESRPSLHVPLPRPSLSRRLLSFFVTIAEAPARLLGSLASGIFFPVRVIARCMPLGDKGAVKGRVLSSKGGAKEGLVASSDSNNTEERREEEHGSDAGGLEDKDGYSKASPIGTDNKRVAKGLKEDATRFKYSKGKDDSLLSTSESVLQLNRIQSAVAEVMASGYLESVRQLRETLMVQEWDLGSRSYAIRRGVALFERWCAEQMAGPKIPNSSGFSYKKKNEVDEIVNRNDSILLLGSSSLKPESQRTFHAQVKVPDAQKASQVLTPKTQHSSKEIYQNISSSSPVVEAVARVSDSTTPVRSTVVSYEDLSRLYENPLALNEIVVDPRSRMIARSLIEGSMILHRQQVHRYCTDFAREVARISPQAILPNATGIGAVFKSFAPAIISFPLFRWLNPLHWFNLRSKS